MGKSIREMNYDEVMNIQTLGLDDTFEFNCKACGKCCRNRNDLLLTPYDVYRLASYFGRTPQEIIERYCEVYIGNSSKMPIVRVVPVPPHNQCPFLRNRKCSVHGSKPVVCRVYPLARIYYANGDGSPRFHLSGASCSHEPKTMTVREWIADVASEEAEEAGKQWMEALSALCEYVQPEKVKSAKTLDKIQAEMFGGLYLAYDMSKPFAPQLRENFEQLKNTFDTLCDGDVPTE